MHPLITQDHIDPYARDGAVLVRGLFNGFVDQIAAGIDLEYGRSGTLRSRKIKAGESGRFFDDCCNWSRIPSFQNVIRQSPVAEVMQDLMMSDQVQLFHDHVLVKEPGTGKVTPWHQDSPYYFVEGQQTISFWAPVDPVEAATLRCVAGSHLSGRSRSCQLVGCRKKLFVQTKAPISRS